MQVRYAAFSLVCALLSSLLLYSEASGTSIFILPEGPRSYGIYIAGSKVGSQRISVTCITQQGKTISYQLSATETRTLKAGDKEYTDSYTITALISADFAPISLEITRTINGEKTSLSAANKEGTVEINGPPGEKTMPFRSMIVSSEDYWSFCAPLLFAAKKPDISKPAKFSRIDEVACALQASNLSPALEKMSFQGKELDATKWTSAGDETPKLAITSDAKGNLLWFAETDKAGIVTTYIREPADCAKSSLDFDAWKALRDKPNPSHRQLIGTPFENPLNHVAKDAEASKPNSSEYIKAPGNAFSINLPEGFTYNTSKLANDEVLFDNFNIRAVLGDRYNDIFNIFVGKNVDGIAPADVLAWYQQVASFTAGIQITGEPKLVRFDNDTQIAYTTVDLNVEGRSYKTIFAATSTAANVYVFTFGMTARFNIKMASEEQLAAIPKMIGSFRIHDQ